MRTKLFIPEKINVGFQLRKDTYSAKLAYIIYWDAKGTLRKENSWETFRDHEIPPEEFKNEPTEGFVLNRNGGGGRGYTSRKEFIRVYDPRGFEIEISLANLLFILQETNSIKGKGLEGEFVYCWEGPTLILLPVGCQEYSKISKFTNIQSQKITAKDVAQGNVFIDKNMKQFVFIEREMFYKRVDNYDHNNGLVEGKRKNIFWDVERKQFVGKDGWTYLASKVSDTSDDWANILDKYSKTIHTQEIDKIITKKVALKYCKYDHIDDYKYFLSPENELLMVNCKKDFEGNRGYYQDRVMTRRHEITSSATIEGLEVLVQARPNTPIEDITQYQCVDLYFKMDDGSTIKRKTKGWWYEEDYKDTKL